MIFWNIIHFFQVFWTSSSLEQYPDISLLFSKKYGFLFSYPKNENNTDKHSQFILVKEESEKLLYTNLDLVGIVS